ncbi:MAG TPA: hypothetical protein VIL47_05980 [Candidatus Bipolaricaulota bacterium]
MTRKFQWKHVGVLLALPLLFAVTGCELLDIVFGGQDGPINGRIVMQQSGGIAGIQRTITIEVRNGVVYLTTVGGFTDSNTEGQVAIGNLQALWKTLEANDAFSLTDNAELINQVADGFSFEVELELGAKRHRFGVYAPELLTDQRYANVVHAIQNVPVAEPYAVFDLQVDSVEVNVLESFPVQVVAVVKGTLDPCTQVHAIGQTREGDTITVHITGKRPIGVFCVQLAVPFEERITLQGEFPTGNYTVIVNGVEHTFSV